jgi:hypothetical protein
MQSRLFEFFITLRPKAWIPLSKRLFQFAIEVAKFVSLSDNWSNLVIEKSDD